MSLKFGGRHAAVVVKPKIIIFGVGGGGCNAVNHMIDEKVDGVEFVIANTDAQSLESSSCENKIQLGASVTGGLGAGSVPDIGRRSAEESMTDIEDQIRDANMVFIACGMGGGTGTGAAPVIAKIAKERGILTIGVVTKPFAFEREKRMKVAEEGISQMRKFCDTTIVIANQNLFRVANANTTLKDAFKMADDVLVSGIRCVTDLITYNGLINLDFADVSVIMSDMDYAVMGEGEGVGEDRAIKAVENAMTNPLLEESSIKGATGVLVNICGGNDLGLFEVDTIMDRVTAELAPGATIKFGSITKEDMSGKIKVSIVATGISRQAESTQPETKKNLMQGQNIIQSQIINNKTQDSTYNWDDDKNSKDEDDLINDEFVNDDIVDEDQQDQYQSNFMEYDASEDDEDDDYFNSFYEKKSVENQSTDAFIENATKQHNAQFVPKKVVNIEEAMNKKKSPEKAPKFDIKSIFKINRGA